MNQNETYNRICELERLIAALPAGSIGKKTVKGNVYYYHRVSANGIRKETYVSAERVAELKELIEKRKLLEKEMKELKASLPHKAERRPESQLPGFRTYIRIGDMLKRYISPVKTYQHRTCFGRIKEFIYDDSTEKVLILYGLRRTGKTTLIRQTIADMSDDTLAHTVFIQIKSSDTLADVNADLKRLESLGYRYIFIDEITLMRDFIEGAALLSDIFAASGMKIVLSGTDSLGFLFSEDEQLFDRCIMVHTTFIPYREFEEVLGRHGIDEYIRYGGTMSLSGINYNENSVFSDAKRTNEYIDSAIAKNIQHSLQFYQDGGHFRSLYDLYEKNELTSAIHRVIEDMNHRFTVDTLTRTFQSNDLSISAGNLRHDRYNPTDILDRVDTNLITEQIKTALEIRNREEQTVAINDIHAKEIQEYLKLLDLVVDIPIHHIPETRRHSEMTVITQPGMRYVQAEALVNSILSDSIFNTLDIVERNIVLERIRSEIMGRMMEEIVLLETMVSNPKKQVFKLQFPVGEFDMVLAEPETLTCRIYEIKHSAQAAPEQYRHLIDEDKCRQTERQYGTITGKYVIYRGDPMSENGINYLNVENYLRTL